ncbi:MAG: hypothetical protein WC934_06830 [Acidithiobacillus sp.]|jgi:hypothetical protein|uniref:hypothetical protein n=1 Tax=Acidithiobacillus sp. TaxID=1872118 RepID=UPI00355E1F1A
MEIKFYERIGYHESYLNSVLTQFSNSTLSYCKILRNTQYCTIKDARIEELIFYCECPKASFMIRTRWNQFGGHPHLTSYRIAIQNKNSEKISFYSNSEYTDLEIKNIRTTSKNTKDFIKILTRIYNIYHLPSLKRIETIFIRFLAFQSIFGNTSSLRRIN